MTKVDALYNWLITFLQRLTESQETEAYVEQFEHGAERDLNRQLESLAGHMAALEVAQADCAAYLPWADLVEDLRVLSSHTSLLTPEKYLQAYVMCALAEKLCTFTGEIDDQQCDPIEFTVTQLSEFPCPPWFSHENGTSFSDSIAVMACADSSALRDKIINEAISPRLLFVLMRALGTRDGLSARNYAFTPMSANPRSPAEIEVLVKLHAIADGAVVHPPHNYRSKPEVLDRDTFRFAHNYLQMADALYVLSEYNSRNDVLAKYLSLYHVIENFMYRKPLVRLERQRGGSMFSLRDFQRLYKEIHTKELDAVKSLFVDSFPLPVLNGSTLKQRVEARWDALPNVEVPEASIDTLLDKLDMDGLTFGAFKGTHSPSHYAKLVYKLRNAIVHNKETEWHLTYGALGKPEIRLIESFMLPSLENVCYTLLGEPNNLVWYNNQSIKVY